MDSKDHIKKTVIEFLPDADEIESSPLPPVARGTLYVLIVALISFLTWAIFTQVDRVVVAKGRLVTPLPNIVVQPLETAIIESLDVRIGQIVQKGEQLATLDPTFAEADQTQLKNRLESLNTQMLRLKAELSGEKESGSATESQDTQLQVQLDAERKANYKAQQMHLSQKIAQLHATISTNLHDQEALAIKLKPIQEIEAMQNSLLNKQFGARLQMLESQQKRLEVERDLQLAKNHERELKSELAALESEKLMFDKGWRQKIMEDLLATERESNELQEQLLKAEKRHRLVKLSSPANSVVLEIAKLSTGSVIKAAETLFTLVPLDAELEAEVQVDSMDVGYIALGDASKIKMDAYPFQRHGALDAKVRTISEDAFRRETAGSGIDAYYLSRIDLGSSHLKNMSAKSRLLPGMTLSAEIVVGKRSVISYLIWPITKGLNESIHEP